RTGQERLMEAVGGLVGVTQDHDTLALRPKVGWAVREAGKMDVCLARLAKDHRTFPGANSRQRKQILSTESASDLSEFYHRTNGTEFVGGDAVVRGRIVPCEEVEPLDWGENPDALGSYGPGGRIWHRIGRLPDGS